jgi:hypothetical protein
MKYTVPALFVICLFIAACKNNSSNNTATSTVAKDSSVTKDSMQPKQDYFPVPAYIGGQLKMIDSFQLPLSESVIINNKTALHAATTSELRTLAQNFMEPDISDPVFKNQYTETNIADQSVPSVTLIYTPKNSELVVQKINVFIKPDPVQSDKVTGIYIEKMFTRNDTAFNQKLYWKTGKNLQVITEKKIKGIVLPVEQIKITWDPSE